MRHRHMSAEYAGGQAFRAAEQHTAEQPSAQQYGAEPGDLAGPLVVGHYSPGDLLP